MKNDEDGDVSHVLFLGIDLLILYAQCIKFFSFYLFYRPGLIFITR